MEDLEDKGEACTEAENTELQSLLEKLYPEAYGKSNDGDKAG